jgi:DNA-binding transcriptional regulator YhcF (GntR family)
MQKVKDILEQHTIVIQNAALRQGFTQIPNYVLRDGRLSFGARLTYTLLLSYAWREGSCFPGQERLAKDLAVSRQRINAYLRELRAAGTIEWLRRGLGKTNVYYVLDIEADVKQALHQDVKRMRQPDVKEVLHKEYAEEEDSAE